MRTFKTIRDAEIAYAQLEERLLKLERGQSTPKGISFTQVKEIISKIEIPSADKLIRANEQDLTFDENAIVHKIFHRFMSGVNIKDFITTDDIYLGYSIDPLHLWYLHVDSDTSNLQLIKIWDNSGTPTLAIVAEFYEYSGSPTEIRVDAHFNPASNEINVLGSSALRWLLLYCKSINVSGTIGIGAAPVTQTGLSIAGVLLAAATFARGINLGASLKLKASADNDILSAIFINPAFDDNGKAGVVRRAIKSLSTELSELAGALAVTGNVNTADVYSVDGTQVVGNRQADPGTAATAPTAYALGANGTLGATYTAAEQALLNGYIAVQNGMYTSLLSLITQVNNLITDRNRLRTIIQAHGLMA